MAGRSGQDTAAVDDLVHGLVGMVRGGHGHQGKGCEQKHRGKFVEGDHLELVQVDRVVDGRCQVKSGCKRS